MSDIEVAKNNTDNGDVRARIHKVLDQSLRSIMFDEEVTDPKAEVHKLQILRGEEPSDKEASPEEQDAFQSWIARNCGALNSEIEKAKQRQIERGFFRGGQSLD
jgi:hypothetical protein